MKIQLSKEEDIYCRDTFNLLWFVNVTFWPVCKSDSNTKMSIATWLVKLLHLLLCLVLNFVDPWPRRVELNTRQLAEMVVSLLTRQISPQVPFVTTMYCALLYPQAFTCGNVVFLLHAPVDYLRLLVSWMNCRLNYTWLVLPILCPFYFKLSINAFDYNCHVDLIKLLRQEGELVRLRKARQKMSELFPLTEGRWLFAVAVDYASQTVVLVFIWRLKHHSRCLNCRANNICFVRYFNWST